MIVVDSSAFVDLAFGRDQLGAWVAAQLRATESLAAPYVVDIEVMGACRSLAHRKVVSDEVAHAAVEAFGRLRLERYPHMTLRERIWELRNSVSAPDAAYVALAEALDVALVTTDRRLARAHGFACEIRSP
ncbi:MAG TPA: type II toxin-antitoxin system VapC family toxin [Gaiella sp.]|jgi:predicted nucleic acid-binding protein|nr:type II toxin-antitoxin system VapC family toxin [Gaiella sp.]